MINTSAFIPIAKPLMGEEELKALEKPVLTGWVTQGPEVQAFEREFAAAVEASYACAVSSGTTALHLALHVIGVKPSDHVITVSHSFIATANSIRYCGAVPVFVDIDPATFNIRPNLIERKITPRTKALLVVHQLGMPCDLKAILPIAKRHGIPVIEDAACAIGSEIQWEGKWERIGKPHGDIACFSFHPRKVVTTGDGGMLTTSRQEWDGQFRLLRQQGMSVSDVKRHGSKEVIFESYPVLGFNYRMTDLQAALGRIQLKRLPEIIEKRRALAARYKKILSGFPELTLPEEPSWAKSNWQSFCVRLSDELELQEVMQMMLDQNIATRRGVMCVHRELSYQKSDFWTCGNGPGACSCPPQRCEHLKESELAQDHGIILPLYPQLTEAEQDRVCDALISACKLVRQ